MAKPSPITVSRTAATFPAGSSDMPLDEARRERGREMKSSIVNIGLSPNPPVFTAAVPTALLKPSFVADAGRVALSLVSNPFAVSLKENSVLRACQKQ